MCVPQPDGTRKCSSDLTPIQSTEEAGAAADGAAKDGQGDAPSDGSSPPQDGGTPPQDTGSPPQDSGGGGDAPVD